MIMIPFNKLTISKILAGVLSLISLVLGYDSHFSSAWKKGITNGNETVVPHKLCNDESFLEDLGDKKCPNIQMERYFLSMIAMNFLLCILVIVLVFGGCAKKTETSKCWLMVNIISHVLRAMLLVAAAIMFGASARQIRQITGSSKEFEKLYGFKADFRYEEKLSAASVAFFQSLVYVVIAILSYNTYRNRKMESI